jgi:hypothetical protein
MMVCRSQINERESMHINFVPRHLGVSASGVEVTYGVPPKERREKG